MAFGALLLALVLTQVDLGRVVAGLGALHPLLLTASIVSSLAFRYVLAYQMSLGLGPLGLSYRKWHLLRTGFISGFYSLILPGGMLTGAAATWYKLSRQDGTAIEVGALVVFFRLVNTLTILAIGFVALCFDSSGVPAGLQAIVGALFLVALLSSVPFLIRGTADWLGRRMRRIAGWGSMPGPLRSKGAEMWRAVSAFEGLAPRATTAIFALSLLSNSLGVLAWFALARATGIPLSVLSIAWVSSLLAIVQMLPVSVAGLGTREAALILLLGHYGISREQAVSYSLAIFGVMVLFGLVGGILEARDLLHGGRKPGGGETTPAEDVDGPLSSQGAAQPSLYLELRSAKLHVNADRRGR